MSTEIFKDGYEGERGSIRLSGPEAQILRENRHLIVRRMHDAMLTLHVQRVAGPPRMGSGSPAYIVEFQDLIGQDAPEPRRARFNPTPLQVSDMPEALKCFDGLRRPYYKVVLLRALHEFAQANGERSDWTWAKIGAAFGFSDRWAEDIYQTAIIQAARSSGVLQKVTKDHAVVVASAWVNKGWMTHLATAGEPRQAVYNLRTKNAVRLDSACAIWVAGPPVAKRIFDLLKPEMRSLLDHGAWYKTHPDVLIEKVVGKGAEIGTPTHIEDIAVSTRALAA